MLTITFGLKRLSVKAVSKNTAVAHLMTTGSVEMEPTCDRTDLGFGEVSCCNCQVFFQLMS